MNKIAFLFPGQGSQFVSMGRDIYDNVEIARKIFDDANSVLNQDIKKICFEGPEDVLKLTINTQPAIVTTSLALLEAFYSKISIKPDYTAGHSLGEYCAMYCANVMDLETVLLAIQKRANLMSSVSKGGMAAIINPPQNSIEETIKALSNKYYVDIANYNSREQTVITGDSEGIEEACKMLLEKGARKAIPLAVSGAFHSKYMKSAGEEFVEFTKNIDLKDSKIPVYTNVDAQPTQKSEDFREKMPRQIYSSVMWYQSIENMAQQGVDTFIEIGPGKVLTGLCKKILPGCNVYNISDLQSLNNVVEKFEQNIVNQAN